MSRMKKPFAICALAVAAAAVPGGAAAAPPPSSFTTKIDNPYLPLRAGSRWVYRETDAEGGRSRVVVTVTHRTKLIANGVRARVVRDVATEGRRVIERTFDWYAQDRRGNVWYLGEDTTAFEPGKPPSKEGSFEAGVDGAQAGIVMRAHPRVGQHYRQEFYRGHAEDRARVMSRREQAEAPAGFFPRTLMTAETSPLEPRVLEYKFYARGVGQVLSVDVSGGSDREELVRYTRGGK
jgi:hypothetical protein